MVLQKILAFFRLRRVPHLELLGRKLEIEIDHLLRRGRKLHRLDGLASRYTLGDLHGQYTLALAGIGKKNTKLALQPEFAKEHLRRRVRLCLIDSFVSFS